MLTIVYPLNFLACLLFALCLVHRYFNRDKNIHIVVQESFVVACLIFSVQVWLFTEILSLGNLLKTPGPMALLYTISFLGFTAGAIFRRKTLEEAVREFRLAPRDVWIVFFTSLIVVFIFLPLLFVAVYYPPRTADSMSYHLPRLVHWIANGNVEFYPTNYFRQLYYQYFPEYLMLPWQLLFGADYFVNTVQVVALVGILFQTALLTRYFGGGARCQLLACLLVLSCPIVLFEAPTTQTDLITTFYFFAFLYFGLKLTAAPSSDYYSRSERLFYAVCMAIALGLSLNSKISVGVFELPFCFWFGWRYLKIYRRQVLSIYIPLILGFLLFNLPYFARNIQVSGKPLGPAEVSQRMSNERFDFGVLLSNTTRNIAAQLLLPVPILNDCNMAFLVFLHDELGLVWDDPQTTYQGSGDAPFYYTAEYSLDDYRSGNVLPLTLLLIVVTTLSCSRGLRWAFPDSFSDRKTVSEIPKKSRRKNDTTTQKISSDDTEKNVSFLNSNVSDRKGDFTFYIGLLILGFLLFSGLFRWQPFGVRLLLPCLLGMFPFIAVGLSRIISGRYLFYFLPILLGVSFLYISFNLAQSAFYDPMLALLGVKDSIVNDENTPKGRITYERQTFILNRELADEYFKKRNFRDRFLFERNYKYFTVAPEYMVDTLSIANKIAESGGNHIGLALDPSMDMWEYPYWPALRSRNPNVVIQWAIFPEYLKRTRNFDPDFVPEFLITDYPPQVVMELFEIEHAWKYRHLVLLKIKGRNPQSLQKQSSPEDLVPKLAY